MNFTRRLLLFVFEFNSKHREHAGMQASDNHFSGLCVQEKTSDRRKHGERDL